MKQTICLFLLINIIFTAAKAGNFFHEESSGLFSLGTRNTCSVFSDHHGSPGIGIGGQTRLQLNNKLNTEWYLDYISSSVGNTIGRNDYHIGWSILYYPGASTNFTQLLQPYLIIGHCFDKAEWFEKRNTSNSISRYSMATQAGLGSHINITPELDISLSAQYMLHFGKELEIDSKGEGIRFIPDNYSGVSGHLLFTISANYKIARLWN